MSVVIATISIVIIGLLVYLALDSVIPKDPPEGGEPLDC